MNTTTQSTEGTVPDYRAFERSFRIEDVDAHFNGSFETGINAAIECCDRHAGDGRVAIRWESQDGRTATVSFDELRERSCRFANFLVSRGVQPGDRVAGLLPRIPDLLVVILGTWRTGAVYLPLFTAFGPKGIEYRLQASGAKLVVSDLVNRPKLNEVADCPTIVTIAGAGGTVPPGDADFAAELARHSADFDTVMRTGSDDCMMLFTSGTTGPAKGVPVPYFGLRANYMYMRYAIDLRPGDRYWNIADPGWAYGLYYAAIGPLLLGQETIFYDGPFTAKATYRLITKYDVNNLAGAPTAFRLLIASGDEQARQVRGRLRAVSSAGEPLNPEVIRWFREVLDTTIHDHYGQTEVGMVLCNYHGLAHPVRLGSAGLAVPGYRLVIVDNDANELPPNTPGNLAIDRSQSPLHYFTGYWQKPTKSFVGNYYLTGDNAELGEDGNITFVGRADDIITSSGYRIGPFDVESALIEHPAVAETAVIGKPDPERKEIVKAFVVLRQGFEASPELAEELQLTVKRRLAAHAYPREIQFVTELPKTPSGKIQRFLLRQQESAAR